MRASLAGLAIVAALAAAPPARAATDAPGDDATARRIMVEIERLQRTGARLYAMDITLTWGDGSTGQRRILGLLRSDAGETRIVYVFTVPSAYRGAALLIRDPEDAQRRDRIWVQLPGLRVHRELPAAGMNLLVPGTGFTYEDARGWIATDRYHFRTIGEGPEIEIEAIPRSDSLVDLVGSARLLIRVDRARSAVTGVKFHDRKGNVVRTYEATDFVQLSKRWLPKRVTTHHAAAALGSVITYRYLKLDQPPPADLFRPAVDQAPLLDRFADWRRAAGHDEAFPDSLP